MNDKFVIGFVSGILASVFQAIFILNVYFLGVTQLRYQDYIATFIYGHQPTGLYESIFAEFSLWLFGGFIGVVFIRLIGTIGKDYHILRSWFYGVVIAFFLYAIAVLFKVPGLIYVDLVTSIMNFSGASIYGISLGLISKKMWTVG